ncbi:hypothetical protein IWX58_000960 [Rubrivivax gelatinosus]|nr:hypothetical protein [Rubrivivax gelatinosus]
MVKQLDMRWHLSLLKCCGQVGAKARDNQPCGHRP